MYIFFREVFIIIGKINHIFLRKIVPEPQSTILSFFCGHEHSRLAIDV